MKLLLHLIAALAVILSMASSPVAYGQEDSSGDQPESLTPRVWPSRPPSDCPFEPSKEITGVTFTGRCRTYTNSDTWYPSWASDDKLYSPFTDGVCPRLDGSWESSNSGLGDGKFATTGQAVLEGNDLANLKVYSLGLNMASSEPYTGRYPCGSYTLMLNTSDLKAILLLGLFDYYFSLLSNSIVNAVYGYKLKTCRQIITL